MSSNPHNVILSFDCRNLTWHQALIWVVLVLRFKLEMLDRSTVCTINKAPFCDPVDPMARKLVVRPRRYKSNKVIYGMDARLI